jgi:hypothetical protein
MSVIDIDSPGRITRREVRVAAASLTALSYLEGVEGFDKGGSIVLSAAYRGIGTIPLSPHDFDAVVDFLRERHEALLTSLEVDPE